MINDITLTNNNLIELSRSQLLSWLNELLKMNLQKVQQLGTGSVYCQLFDVLYPNKIQLFKVNFKAKAQNEFINNLKVLQQAFSKMGIMRPIEIEKIVKCKYQDNFQFLQWFKKIYDSSALVEADKDSNREYKNQLNPVYNNRENKNQVSAGINKGQVQMRIEFNRNEVRNSRCKDQEIKREQDNKKTSASTSHRDLTPVVDRSRRPSAIQKLREPSLPNDLSMKVYQEEKLFYLRKFKEIQHLMEEWNTDKTSKQLIDSIRQIILVAPQVNWKVQNGQFVNINE